MSLHNTTSTTTLSQVFLCILSLFTVYFQEPIQKSPRYIIQMYDTRNKNKNKTKNKLQKSRLHYKESSVDPQWSLAPIPLNHSIFIGSGLPIGCM